MKIVDPSTVPELSGSSVYPAPYQAAVAGRRFRRLGDAAGLQNFGVNLVRLDPGAASSQRHWHTAEDEFVWILEGTPTLVTDEGERMLHPGTGVGFPKGVPNGHHLINKTDQIVVMLAIGDRADNDDVYYPDIDMQIVGGVVRRKDGTTWDPPSG